MASKPTNQRSVITSSSSQLTNLDLSSLFNDADTTQLDSARTKSPVSVEDLNSSRSTVDPSTFQANYVVDPTLCSVAEKHEINPTMIEHLQKLQGFKIVIVYDDSGSMMNNYSNIRNTQRDELCRIVKVALDLGIIFDTSGVDIHFLKKEISLKVKDPEAINWVFATPVINDKPLVFVLDAIFESSLSHAEEETKLLVVVVTDGEVTDENGNSSMHSFEQSMFARQSAETTYVSVFLYTDDHSRIEYFNEPDRTMKHVNVVGDFEKEKNKIYRSGESDYRFSFGDYVVRALLGAVDPENRCLRRNGSSKLF